MVAAALSSLVACKKRPVPSGSDGSVPAPHVATREIVPTYGGRVGDIFSKSCLPCHGPEGVGAIDLTRFSEAQGSRDRIVEETKATRMPPWLPNQDACSSLQSSRRLSAAELTDLEAWAAAGGPEGERRTLVAPKPTKVPEPMRTVAPAEPYAPKRARKDDYRCFVLDPAIDVAENVTGFRVTAGAPAIVHHVILFEVREQAVPELMRREAEDREVGYPCFGGIGVNPAFRKAPLNAREKMSFDVQLVAGWAPGANALGATMFPDGTAVHLAARSRLVMQVHYNLAHVTPNMVDRTRIELYGTRDSSAVRQAYWVPVLNRDFRIPGGVGPEDPRSLVEGSLTLPVRAEVFGVAPHMHLHGASVRVRAKDESREEDNDTCLLDIPQWDFHDQEMYWLEKSELITQTSIQCRFDNAGSSVDGGRAPTIPLVWGEGTDDEMCLAFLYATF